MAVEELEQEEGGSVAHHKLLGSALWGRPPSTDKRRTREAIEILMELREKEEGKAIDAVEVEVEDSEMTCFGFYIN